ncbi:hypothetical protein Tco_0743164 [Tanacetum coccineum]
MGSIREVTSYSHLALEKMVKGCPMWTVRYVVNTDEFMTPLPDRWSIWSTMWSIGLAEREKDSFLIESITQKILYGSLFWLRGRKVDQVRLLPLAMGLFCVVVRHDLSGVFRLAVDSRKSSHYRVVQAGGEAEGLNRKLKHCKLNMKDHDHPIMTSLEIAHGLHRGRNFLESFGGPINDLILLLMEIPHMLHLEGKIFELCGCLLLVCRDDIGSTEFTIYEMMKGSSMWSVSICLGEGEEDAFVVINLSGKVVKYNLISKTNTEIFDIGSNQMDDDDADDAVVFIPLFEVDPNLYEFIPSLASV